MSILIFLGPSLDLDSARGLCDATYLPPARMGDIYRACARRPHAIGLIDGLFEHTPAVWHKEILHALAIGIRVYGGSSMGALRAAELHSFGMRGVGRIFGDFASGVLEDDDEVALIHGPADTGYACQSEAMANIRCALEAAVLAGALDAEQARHCIAAAKALHYPERTWPQVFRLARAGGIAAGAVAALESYIARERPNQKRDDAIATLTLIDQERAAGPGPAPGFTFESTSFWETLRSECEQAEPGVQEPDVRADRLASHARLFATAPAPQRHGALLLHLAAQEAARLQLPQPAPDIMLDALYARRGRATPAERAAWLAENDLDAQDALELARLEHQLLECERRARAPLRTLTLKALKLGGTYAQARRHAGAKWRSLDRDAFDSYTQADIAPLEQVLAWYGERHGAPGADLAGFAARLGFDTLRELITELNAEYLYQRIDPDTASTTSF